MPGTEGQKIRAEQGSTNLQMPWQSLPAASHRQETEYPRKFPVIGPPSGCDSPGVPRFRQCRAAGKSAGKSLRHRVVDDRLIRLVHGGGIRRK